MEASLQRAPPSHDGIRPIEEVDQAFLLFAFFARNFAQRAFVALEIRALAGVEARRSPTLVDRIAPRVTFCGDRSILAITMRGNYRSRNFKLI